MEANLDWTPSLPPRRCLGPTESKRVSRLAAELQRDSRFPIQLEFPFCPTKSRLIRVRIRVRVKMKRLAYRFAPSGTNPEPALPKLRHLWTTFATLLLT